MAGKNVFADASDVYVKSGSTEFQIATSTGGLMHQSTALPNSSQLAPLKLLTWPSTVAHTLVDTTTTQSMTGKTVNNITITNPGTAATLNISSGGILGTTGAFQAMFAVSANSKVTLPASTLAVLMWTTDAAAQVNAPTTQLNS